MELEKYFGKNVRVVTMDNETFTGEVEYYIPAQDNIPEIESITIGDIEIYSNEIKSISLIA